MAENRAGGSGRWRSEHNPGTFEPGATKINDMEYLGHLGAPWIGYHRPERPDAERQDWQARAHPRMRAFIQTLHRAYQKKWETARAGPRAPGRPMTTTSRNIPMPGWLNRPPRAIGLNRPGCFEAKRGQAVRPAVAPLTRKASPVAGRRQRRSTAAPASCGSGSMTQGVEYGRARHGLLSRLPPFSNQITPAQRAVRSS